MAEKTRTKNGKCQNHKSLTNKMYTQAFTQKVINKPFNRWMIHCVCDRSPSKLLISQRKIQIKDDFHENYYIFCYNNFSE